MGTLIFLLDGLSPMQVMLLLIPLFMATFELSQWWRCR
jgi:hypothetical protein